MATKSAERKTEKNEAGKDNHDETPVPSKKAKGTKATPAPETTRPETPTATSTDTPEIVVFAFRLTRAERDEIHAVTGSARTSRFVKAIVLAGVRGDMKAVQEAIDEVHATRH